MGPDVESLLATAARDRAQRPAFLRALLDSSVLVLGEVLEGVSGGVAGPGGASATIVAFGDRDGPFMPFFTSEAALQDTLRARPGAGASYLRFDCRALFEMTAGRRLVLNPDSAHGKEFLPDEIAAALAGTEAGLVTEVLPAGRRIMVGGAARVPPPELVTVLARFFAQRPVVEAAHLGWIVHEDGHSGYLVTVIAADHHLAMAGFGSLQIGELTGGPTLDVMVVDTAAESTLARTVEPFYIRT